MHEQDIQSLETILRFTTRLGSARSHGSGQIKISNTQFVEWPKDNNPIDVQEGAKTLRLLMLNTQPMTIPKAAIAANIIESESHLSGRILLSAFANERLKTNPSVEKSLIKACLSAMPIHFRHQWICRMPKST